MGVKSEKAIKIIKKTGRTLAWVIGFFIYLGFVLTLLIRNPKVQTVICQRFAKYMSEELQTRVTVKGIDIEFIKTLVLEGFYVEDRHQDTLLLVDRLKVDVSRFSYDEKFVSINSVLLDGGTVKLKKYAGEKGLSYRFITQYFKSTDTTKHVKKAPWTVKLGNIGLRNVNFDFIDTRDTIRDRGMDYEDIRVTGLSGDFNDIDPMNDSLSFRVHDLRAKEQSGFTLLGLNSLMTVADTFARFDELSIETPGSKIEGWLSFQFHETDDIADDFIHRVKMDGHFSNSKVEMGDIAYFSPNLLGIKKTVYVTGDLRGTVEHLRCKNIDLRFGEKSHVKGNFAFNGLPDINETDMNFKIREAVTNKKDLEGIPVAPFGPGDSLDVPANVAQLGDIRFTGSFEGFIHDFVAHGTLSTAIGSVTMENLAMQQLSDSSTYSYLGRVHTSGFNVGSYFDIPGMGAVAANLDVKGSGFTNSDIDANVTGTVSSLQFRGYTYTGIAITNTHLKRQVIDGDIHIDDPNLGMDFTGLIDNSKRVPHFEFKAQIDSANLGELGFLDKQHEYLFSATVSVNINGNNIDNVTGSAQVNDLAYRKDGENFKFNTLTFFAGETSRGRQLNLESDIASASVYGNFQLMKLPMAVRDIMSDYLPAYFPPPDAKKKKEIGDQQFSWNVKFNRNTRPLQALVPELQIAPNTYSTGSFNSNTHKFNATLVSDQVVFNGITYRGINFGGGNQQNGNFCRFEGTVTRIQLNDTLGADNFRTTINANDNNVLATIDWKNNSQKANDGTIAAHVKFEGHRSISMSLDKAELHVNDSAWAVNPGNLVRIDSSHVMFKDLVFHSGDQSIGLNGAISRNANEALNVSLNKFNLAYFNYFTQPQGMAVKGYISSETTLSDLYNTPIFNSSTEFSGFYVNDQKIGNGNLSANWLQSRQAVYVHGNFSRGVLGNDSLPIDNILFEGNYYPKKKENSIDINVTLRSVPLETIKPLFSDFCSIMVGQIDGSAHIGGIPSKPLVKGDMDLAIRKVKVDYLGIEVRAATQKIKIQENSFFFDDYKVVDTYGDTAKIYGHLFHENYSNFQFDMDFSFDHFMVLNTTEKQNELYYGRVFATGYMNLFGYVNDKISIDMKARTDKIIHNGQVLYSEFNIPMSSTSEAGSTDFITFVDHTKQDTLHKPGALRRNGLELNLEVQATQDAYVKVVFDKTVGDELTAYGDGNINMKITPDGDFSMFGNYTVAKGNYLFTMKNVIYVPFELSKGGTIRWNGDPYEAQIDADAIYRATASVEPFFPLDSVNPNLHRSYPVNVIMHLDGALMNPGVGFDIDLPTADQNIRETVKSYTQTELERNRQVLSLMVLNSFMTPTELRTGADAGTNYGGAGSTLLSNFVSGTLNNWLSQINTDLDMKVQYRPTDQLGAEELKVYMQYALLNNRVSIETNFGKVNATQATTAQNTTQWVGDANVEYKVTEDGKVRFRAFNRSNQNTVLNYSSAPYTQGVGILYREEFDTRQQLARRLKAYISAENSNREKKEAEKPKADSVPNPAPADSTGTH